MRARFAAIKMNEQEAAPDRQQLNGGSSPEALAQPDRYGTVSGRLTILIAGTCRGEMAYGRIGRTRSFWADKEHYSRVRPARWLQVLTGFNWLQLCPDSTGRRTASRIWHTVTHAFTTTAACVTEHGKHHPQPSVGFWLAFAATPGNRMPRPLSSTRRYGLLAGPSETCPTAEFAAWQSQRALVDPSLFRLLA